ncbi:MAG: hypothetical protein COC24_000695 [Alphaproteobacteria bacterium]|nr:hypothetical protein [Alphaproteobacteria bacterium]
MMNGLMRVWDNLFGLGDAAVTVPPLDGPLRANQKLDESNERYPLSQVDCLTVVSKTLFASSKNAIYTLKDDQDLDLHSKYQSDIASILAINEDSLAVALVTGEIFIQGGVFDGRKYKTSKKLNCITALAINGAHLYIANGSTHYTSDNWQIDLLGRNMTGSIWRIDLESSESTCILEGLAYPAGLVIDEENLVYTEAWKHQIVSVDISGKGEAHVIYADLPGYPSRIIKADDGYWLAIFAPRSQLVEYVLRETAYCKRMVKEIPQAYWIAPKLRSGQSFYEPLQGGSVKHFGQLKPWAPTMSSGLVVKLDGLFQPNLSLHSRADGHTHGVTSLVEYNDSLFVAARGDEVVVSIPLGKCGDEE